MLKGIQLDSLVCFAVVVLLMFWVFLIQAAELCNMDIFLHWSNSFFQNANWTEKFKPSLLMDWVILLALWMNPDLHCIYIDHYTHHSNTEANKSCGEILRPQLKTSVVLISACEIYLGSHYRMKSESIINSIQGKFFSPHQKLGIISDGESHPQVNIAPRSDAHAI